MNLRPSRSRKGRTSRVVERSELERRPVPDRTAQANATLAFFEAYCSNFIEGTEFSGEEAAQTVFDGVIPNERPEDAHDVLETFRVVSGLSQLRVLPTDVGGFRELLQGRHASAMEARPDKVPGAFKERGNQAGAPSTLASAAGAEVTS